MRLTSLALIATLCLLTGCPHRTTGSKQPPPTGYFCNSTDPKTYIDPNHPYPTLQGGTTVRGQTQYSGQILTQTPGYNPGECAIRQRYFLIPSELKATVIQTVLVHHDGRIVTIPIDYTTDFAGPNLYRVDAHANEAMTGDYDLMITVTGMLGAAQK